MAPIIQIYRDGEWVTPASLNLASLAQAIINQQPQSLSFSAPISTVTDDPLYDEDDELYLRLLYDDATYDILFRGTISTVQHVFEPSLAINYQANDLWKQLAQRVYIRTGDIVEQAYNRSHTMLFRDDDAEKITVGAQIQSVLDYAIDELGLPLSYIQTELDLLTNKPPADEQYDLTIAEIIIKGLRWHPDFTAFIQPPAEVGGNYTIRFIDPDNATSLSYNSVGATSCAIARKKDMELDGVQLYYEFEQTLDSGWETTEVSEDTGGDTTADRVLVSTTMLSDEYEEQELIGSTEIKVEAIPSPWYDDLDWISSQISGTITALASAHRAPTPAGNFHIKSGYVSGYGIQYEEVEFYVLGVIDGVNGAERTFNLKTCSYSEDQWFYKYNTYTVAAEEAPAGAAAALYAALSLPVYAGNYAAPLALADGFTLPTPEHRFNLADGPDKFKTMDGVIQQSTYNYMTESISLTFGSASHLGVDDYIDLLLSARKTDRPTRRKWYAG
jgi:hypothetical protein